MTQYINYIQQVLPNSKYTNTYCNLMTKAMSRKLLEYCERHHIVPRSIKPEWSKCSLNVVELTAREHFVAHLLLTKIFNATPHKHKMIKALTAFGRVNNNQCRLFTSWEYKKLREAYISSGKQDENITRLQKQNTKRQNTTAYTNGSHTMFLTIGVAVPDGYVPGMHTKGQRLITNGILTRRISKEEALPDGFWFGSSIRTGKQNPLKGKPRRQYETDAARHKNISADAANRCWINDGTVNKRQLKHLPVPPGWHPGRCGALAMKQTRPCDVCGKLITLANYERHSATHYKTD